MYRTNSEQVFFSFFLFFLNIVEISISLSKCQNQTCSLSFGMNQVFYQSRLLLMRGKKVVLYTNLEVTVASLRAPILIQNFLIQTNLLTEIIRHITKHNKKKLNISMKKCLDFESTTL